MAKHMKMPTQASPTDRPVTPIHAKFDRFCAIQTVAGSVFTPTAARIGAAQQESKYIPSLCSRPPDLRSSPRCKPSTLDQKAA